MFLLSIGRGCGYYSFRTKEAYELLLKRISYRITVYKNAIDGVNCWIGCCGCFCCIPLLRQHEKNLTELEDLEKLVQAVYNSSSPNMQVQLSPDVMRRLEERGYRSDTGTSDTGASTSFFVHTTSGGCGGT
jgi:hypothetical protein